MKRFSFPLESLRRYRESLFQREQARLEVLLAEYRNLEQRRAELSSAVERYRLRIHSAATIEAHQLTAFQAFQRYASGEIHRIAGEKTALALRIEQQKQALRLAQRNVEALEKLKERRLQSWRQELDREMEEAVAELVIARFKSPAGT